MSCILSDFPIGSEVINIAYTVISYPFRMTADIMNVQVNSVLKVDADERSRWCDWFELRSSGIGGVSRMISGQVAHV